jgi:hypothetical protein
VLLDVMADGAPYRDASTGPIGVYIEGIPYAATESDLRKHFEACGAITSVRMPRSVVFPAHRALCPPSPLLTSEV